MYGKTEKKTEGQMDRFRVCRQALKMTGSILAILKIDRFNSLIMWAIPQVPMCQFQKSKGSMEPVEPVLTTALRLID